MTPEDFVVVLVTAGSDEEAARLGRTLVDERLAACANVVGPIRSIYRWQGAVEEAAEVAAIFKTGQQRLDALMAAIHAAHSYDVPAIVALPIASTHGEYLAWVLGETGED